MLIPGTKSTYVVNNLQALTPVELADGTSSPAIRTAPGTVAVAITADGRTDYVTRLGDTVVPVDVATGRAGVRGDRLCP